MNAPAKPSTDSSRDADGAIQPAAEKGAVGPSSTHSTVDGEVAPRLPHERDESSDSGTGEPSEVMEKAAGDAERGHTDRQRGPETQRQYSDLMEKDKKGAHERGTEPAPKPPQEPARK